MLYTYDPKKVLMLVGGIPMQGFADDTFVSVELDDDLYTPKAGVDGDISRSRIHGRLATVKVTLMQTSPSNLVLSGFMTADILTNAGVVPFLLQDGLGTTDIFSAYIWVRKPPPVTFGKEVVGREWTFSGAGMTQVIGGNTPVFG